MPAHTFINLATINVAILTIGFLKFMRRLPNKRQGIFNMKAMTPLLYPVLSG